VRHPRAYAQRLASGASPAQAREVLGPVERHEERVMLAVRLVEGLPLDDLEPAARGRVAGLVADGLVEPRPALGAEGRPRCVLTLRGRLLADSVVRTLLR
jgi:oxygen-independent coproporphyrinogen-3 oxidase